MSYDRFYDYESLSELLRSWAEDAPGLAELSSIGRSWEGRDIWLMTLTNTATGPHSDKPGFLVEANIHAAEITGSFAALHLIHRLLSGYGQDERVTRLLDTRTLYVVPRLNPDGVEKVLGECRYVRSSVRPHPQPGRKPGLHGCDVDGDGRVLFMRVPDPDGPWKAHPDEPRLLVRREPDEEGGLYYRIFLEGEIEGYDGVTVPVADPVEGLDLGQNLPADWGAAPETPVHAGPYPGSEPEIQAIMRAAAERPNLVHFVTCHTFGGVHLRPPMNDDEPMPYADLRVYQEYGEKAERLTGYTAMSFHDLKFRPGRFYGGQLGWWYGQRGLFSWITELWSPMKAAGVQGAHPPSVWLGDHPAEDALTMIRWSDEELGGKGFVDWYPFDHPQLGPVELGGWDKINYWYNPPLDRVEAEVAPHSEWIVFMALTSPRLEIRSLSSEQVSPGVHRVQLVLRNAGWLPTYGSKLALERKVAGSIAVDLTLPEGARLLSGQPSTDLGQLEGRSEARTTTTWWGHEPGTPDLAVTEWTIAAPEGTPVAVRAHHPKAGAAQATLTL
ncbi:hypothetical protein HNP84_000976 [Thermocatellispora tengchongensis]|uniref:Peptidase M14 domain-containing protein n=1 Tax=Thermocatellispora tengchongensis TaxID=1073253 RepID=A0A840P1C8_9ACTN|nr:M14 family metallopeptidase [Thermocatellispora tengchongensis]MBB5131270.1 hypothetical protein [Thermocatellispora tengchongensis]